MANYSKEWKSTDIYKIEVEFSRIECYNNYVETWLREIFKVEIEELDNKLEYSYDYIPDVSDYNRVKSNINKLLSTLKSNIASLSLNGAINQSFNQQNANELEVRLTDNLILLGDMQFSTKFSGVTICGGEIYLGMEEN